MRHTAIPTGEGPEGHVRQGGARHADQARRGPPRRPRGRARRLPGRDGGDVMEYVM